MFTVTPYSMDGQLIENGSFSLLTKSIFKAEIDAKSITDLSNTIIHSDHFVLIGEADRRYLVAKE